MYLEDSKYFVDCAACTVDVRGVVYIEIEQIYVVRHLVIINSDETSEEINADEELQGEPGSPAQKSVSYKIKPTSPVVNDDLSLADSWGDYNFAQAETADAVTEFEQMEIAVESASQADGKSCPPKGGCGGRGRERPPTRGCGGREAESDDGLIVVLPAH